MLSQTGLLPEIKMVDTPKDRQFCTNQFCFFSEIGDVAKHILIPADHEFYSVFQTLPVELEVLQRRRNQHNERSNGRVIFQKAAADPRAERITDEKYFFNAAAFCKCAGG